jgi:hypothetical protein
MKVTTFWDTALCSLTAYCLNHRAIGCEYLKHRFTSTRLHGAVSQKSVILTFHIFAASFVVELRMARHVAYNCVWSLSFVQLY